MIRPKVLNGRKLFVKIGLLFVGGSILSRYGRSEFMKQVRERNELMKQDKSAPREMGPINIQALDGRKVSIDNIDSEYVVVVFGEYKNLLRVIGSMNSSLYNQEVHFVYVTDKERLIKILKGVMRTPIPNT